MTPATPAESWRRVRLATKTGPIDWIGWPCSVAGLLITPAIGIDMQPEGWWAVTHEATGLTISSACCPSIPVIQWGIEKHLAGLDWTSEHGSRTPEHAAAAAAFGQHINDYNAVAL